MVKIRLKRGGTKKKPFYRIVATDERNPRDGRNLEIIGYYHPRISDNETKLKKYEVDEEKLLKWYRDGAQLTDTVKRIVKEIGLQEKITRK